MIVYWKYNSIGSNRIFIFKRNTKTKEEKSVYDSTEIMNNEWYPWDADTMEEERKLNCDTLITEISREEVEEISFIGNL